MSRNPMRRMMGVLAAALAAVAPPALLAGCNTVEGAGEDVSGVGRGVSNVAGQSQEAMFGENTRR